MSETNGTGMLAGYREYHCDGCGRYLFETNVPLGTPGIERITCPDRMCKRSNNIPVGREPRPQRDRVAWLARRRPRAVSLDRLIPP